ncbi:HAMP domain-containing sensor histidine kinase [Streptomyces sp. DSM 44917]|uniref:histidine kinase n=1 Tax=Streptomyces boetiae TaxID=3075541 RepID=A0ABU2LEH5_9ACTN|nr:HAMP domain-containing sensor histidine kinase [Streptomyces sp. DSM 44917]MDT0309578.1 HAMP domain-containing sensor histidine kinase [Streptomyces sp. DSM 44917]
MRGRERQRGRKRLALRARLALINGVLFLLAGVLLLGLTYALFSQRLGGGINHSESSSGEGPVRDGQEAPELSATTSDGRTATGPEADALIRSEEQVRDAATRTLLGQGAVALLIVGALAAGSGWVAAGRVLAPLHRVTDTARRIAAAPVADRGLYQRIALPGPDDEVKDLADAFDTMVERLDRSFAGQRRFVANASHELRTPLTVSRALVELAMHRAAASPEVRQLGEQLLDINARHERLINGLLLLAGSENDIPERFPVDLADVAAHVLAQAAAEARHADVHLDFGVSAEAVTQGDALLLERLVHNLVENGIRHNTRAPGAWVRVETRAGEGGTAVVEVANSGPVVAPYDVPTLFEPFRRLGDDRLVTAGGAGLGLSIVRAVARAHDGEVAARPREGGGLVVTVTLPAAPQAGEAAAEMPPDVPGANVQPGAEGGEFVAALRTPG